MNFNQMECFLCVISEESIAKAARKLYVSESAISQTIRKLESELNAPLFNRSARRMTLTPVGRKFHRTVLSMVREYKSFLNETLDNDQVLVGELSISLSERRAKKILPMVMPEFMRTYPNVSIRVQDQRMPVENRENILIEGRSDFAISNHKSLRPELASVFFCKEQLTFVVSKRSPIAKRLFPDGRIPDTIAMDRICGEPLILQQRMFDGRLLIDRVFQDINKTPNVLMEITYSETAKELAVAGIGCALESELLVKNQENISDRGDYYAILVDHPLAQRDVYVLYNQLYTLSRYHNYFLELLARTFGSGERTGQQVSRTEQNPKDKA